MTQSSERHEVLVVDDEPQMLTSIRDLLDDEFIVRTALDAQAAFQALQQTEVAVILSDQRMPDVTGDQFLKRAREVSPAIRVLMTGYADVRALVRAVNDGQIYAYLAKPWEPLELKATVQKAAQHYELTRDLARECDLLHALMNNIPDTIYFKNADLQFTRINGVLADVMGLAHTEEAAGKTDADFLPPDFARRAIEEERQIVSSRRPIRDKVERIQRHDGEWGWYSTTKAPIIDAEQRVAGLVGISREITARKQAEETLARQAQQLARSNAELEEFAYVAAHDLQEPLRTMASFAQLLGQRYKGKLDADAERYIQLVVSAAHRMRTLIDDLLAYSRVARREVELTKADCAAALQSALESLRVAIEETGAVVTHEPLPTIVADFARLKQVFQNLIGNALKFRSAKPPRVHVATGRCHRSEWLFSVTDNGIGLDPAYADRIFQMFGRLHGKDEYPGTGVGLALCKRIIEAHHGRIWVESEPGKGATFSFTIPEQEGRRADA